VVAKHYTRTVTPPLNIPAEVQDWIVLRDCQVGSLTIGLRCTHTPAHRDRARWLLPHSPRQPWRLLSSRPRPPFNSRSAALACGLTVVCWFWREPAWWAEAHFCLLGPADGISGRHLRNQQTTASCLARDEQDSE